MQTTLNSRPWSVRVSWGGKLSWVTVELIYDRYRCVKQEEKIWHKWWGDWKFWRNCLCTEILVQQIWQCIQHNGWFFPVRLKQHPSCCHPIGQNWPHKRAHYRDKEVIQPEAKHRALFVPQQNILPSVTPHFWWRLTLHSSGIFCRTLQQNILQVTNAPHLSWYYIGLHLPFSEILLGRQFSMLILTYSFSFYHIQFTNIARHNTRCARLTNKMTGITEICHATFWQNILPLKSHCMMSAALAASARVEYPYCACAMEYYSRIFAGTNRPQNNLK